jgi:TDG/mug DNA glycosylase family protein
MLPDILEPGVRVVILGSAKSHASVAAGHYYAHPQNHFWRLLFDTGLIGDEPLTPERDREVLRFGVGMTDLVAGRAESSDANLTARDFDVPGFVERMERLRPEVVAFNGGTPATQVARFLGHRVPAIGPCDWRLAGAATWRLPSSSARNARGGYGAKREQWVVFGDWVRTQLEGPDLGAAKVPD